MSNTNSRSPADQAYLRDAIALALHGIPHALWDEAREAMDARYRAVLRAQWPSIDDLTVEASSVRLWIAVLRRLRELVLADTLPAGQA